MKVVQPPDTVVGYSHRLEAQIALAGGVHIAPKGETVAKVVSLGE